MPEEWYLDRENGILYLYPPDELENCVINLSITTQNLLKIEDASHITVKEFTFTATRADAISINSDYVTIDNCEIKNVGGTAVKIWGNHCAVSNCHK